MTVSQLIKELENLDPDLKVFVRGYEGGYDYASVSHEMEFVLNYNTEWYYGKHEEATFVESKSNLKPTEKVRGIVL